MEKSKEIKDYQDMLSAQHQNRGSKYNPVQTLRHFKLMIEKTKLRIQLQEEGMLGEEALLTQDKTEHQNFVLKEVEKIKN